MKGDQGKSHISNVSLNAEDVKRLMQDSSGDAKGTITSKLANHYNKGGFSEAEQQLAEQIFRLLAKDAEVQIRSLLANQIKSSEIIPKDIVLKLAHDVEEVSLPVLEFSEVLSSDDLVDIIKSSKDEAKHLAISKRRQVLSDVSDALIDTNSKGVVNTLLGNLGAEIEEREYNKIVDVFAEEGEVLGSMVERGSLPVGVVQALSEKISESMRKTLAEKHPAAFELIEEELRQIEEAATMKVIGLKATDEQIEGFYKLMKRLKIADHLAPLYALCMGNLNLFEVSLARVTKVPVLNIRYLSADKTNKGFRALYERAKMPPHLYAAAELLVEVLRDIMEEVKAKNEPIEVSREYANRILESLVTKAGERGNVENLDYIVGLVSKHAQ